MRNRLLTWNAVAVVMLSVGIAMISRVSESGKAGEWFDHLPGSAVDPETMQSLQGLQTSISITSSKGPVTQGADCGYSYQCRVQDGGCPADEVDTPCTDSSGQTGTTKYGPANETCGNTNPDFCIQAFYKNACVSISVGCESARGCTCTRSITPVMKGSIWKAASN